MGGWGRGEGEEERSGKSGSRGLHICAWQPCTNSDMFSLLATT